MRYFSILLFFNLLLYLSCNNKPEADKDSPSKPIVEVNTSDPVANEPDEVAFPSSPDPETEESKFSNIEGVSWVLSSYTFEGNRQKPLGSSDIHLEIEGNQLTGNGGCNDISGKIVLSEDGAVRVSGVSKTKKLCRGLMTQEIRVLELLEGAESFKVNLVFLEFDGPEGKLTFRNDQK